MSKVGSKSITFSECSLSLSDGDVNRTSEFRPHSASCSARICDVDRPRRNGGKFKRSGSLSTVERSKSPAAASTTAVGESHNSFPDVQLNYGPENVAEENKCNGNVFTISQPSGRTSPGNNSFRKETQLDSVSTNDVRPPSSEDSFESNGSAIRRNLTTLLSLIYAIFLVTLGCIFTSTYHGRLFSMKAYNEVLNP